MEIVSVQLGRRRDVLIGGRPQATGIDKQPVPHITLGTEGADGDAIVTTQHHGGPGQAAYLYSRSDYAVFEEALGVSLAPGTFGENVTVDSWPHEVVRIGDRFAFADVVLEVTSPRIPCATFAGRMAEVLGRDGAKGWVRRFTAARRPGWYVRVLSPGTLSPGMVATVIPADEDVLTGMEMWDLYHDAHPDPALVARALAAPIAERSREAWSVSA